MDCESFRLAISARLDGEDPGMPEPALRRHLAACGACRAWEADAHRVTRSVRLGAAPQVPDLTAAILSRGGPDREGDLGRLARAGLLVSAAAQVLLTTPLLVGDGSHVAREGGAWGLALAVGFLTAAHRPERAAGMLPLVAAAVGCLLVAVGLDVAAGRATAAEEAPHALAGAGLFLLWILARLHPRDVRLGSGRPA